LPRPLILLVPFTSAFPFVTVKSFPEVRSAKVLSEVEKSKSRSRLVEGSGTEVSANIESKSRSETWSRPGVAEMESGAVGAGGGAVEAVVALEGSSGAVVAEAVVCAGFVGSCEVAMDVSLAMASASVPTRVDSSTVVAVASGSADSAADRVSTRLAVRAWLAARSRSAPAAFSRSARRAWSKASSRS